jgi:uncharacterized membrane protein
MCGMHHPPNGPAFDIVLLLHVGCVVAGLATTLASTAMAARLRRLLAAATPLPEALVRYFRPGVNWAGRSIWGIPVFGFALLALSHGAYGLQDGWIMSGVVIFVVAAVSAEAVLWPAERRLQALLAPAGGEGAAPGEFAQREARVMALSAAAILVLLVAGSVVMVAQP